MPLDIETLRKELMRLSKEKLVDELLAALLELAKAPTHVDDPRSKP